MKDPKREYKSDIKYKITLNEEQKEAKRLIINNQIVVITGRAGSGKSLVGAQENHRSDLVGKILDYKYGK